MISILSSFSHKWCKNVGVASIQIIFLKENGKAQSMSRDRLSMQIDLKNMSKIKNVKQKEHLNLKVFHENTRRPHLITKNICSNN
jgi:hypothetical protein